MQEPIRTSLEQLKDVHAHFGVLRGIVGPRSKLQQREINNSRAPMQQSRDVLAAMANLSKTRKRLQLATEGI